MRIKEKSNKYSKKQYISDEENGENSKETHVEHDFNIIIKSALKNYDEEAKRKNKLKRFLGKTVHWLENFFVLTLSVITSVGLCSNLDNIHANFDKVYRLQLADELRQKNEYTDAIDWYERIISDNAELAPYAHVAIAEIFSIELSNKSYDEAIKHYKLAVENSNDIRIYKSAFYFIVNQIEISRTINQTGISCVKSRMTVFDLKDEDFKQLAICVVNGLAEMFPEEFERYQLEFPVDEQTIDCVFEPSEMPKLKKWEYVSTLTSLNSGLAFTSETEKLVLVDNWSELISTTSFESQIVYKYYRYRIITESEQMTVMEYTKQLAGEPCVYSLMDIKEELEAKNNK